MADFSDKNNIFRQFKDPKNKKYLFGCLMIIAVCIVIVIPAFKSLHNMFHLNDSTTKETQSEVCIWQDKNINMRFFIPDGFVDITDEMKEKADAINGELFKNAELKFCVKSSTGFTKVSLLQVLGDESLISEFEDTLKKATAVTGYPLETENKIVAGTQMRVMSFYYGKNTYVSFAMFYKNNTLYAIVIPHSSSESANYLFDCFEEYENNLYEKE